MSTTTDCFACGEPMKKDGNSGTYVCPPCDVRQGTENKRTGPREPSFLWQSVDGVLTREVFVDHSLVHLPCPLCAITVA